MGLNDAAEMLEVAKEQAIADERTIARLGAELDAAGLLIADQAAQLQRQANVLFQAGEQHGILWRERHALESQLEAVRALCRDSDAVQSADVLAIVGTQPAPSGDEHDRTA